MRPRPVSVVAAAQVAGGIALGLIRFVGGNAVVRSAEWWIGDLAMAVLVAAPALLVLLHPSRLALATGGLSTLLLASTLLLSVAGLPLLPFGVVYVVAALRRAAPSSGRMVGWVVATLMVGVPVFMLSLLVGNDRVCWTERVYDDGRVDVERDARAEAASSSGVMFGGGGLLPEDVESQGGGCSEGVVPPERSLLAIVVTAMGLGTVARSPRPGARGARGSRPSPPGASSGSPSAR